MNITKSQLKRIIKEELENITEAGFIGNIPEDQALIRLWEIRDTSWSPTDVAEHFVQQFKVNFDNDPEKFKEILQENLENIKTLAKNGANAKKEYINNLKKLVSIYSEVSNNIGGAVSRGGMDRTPSRQNTPK